MPSTPPTAPTSELGHVAPWSAFAGWPSDPGEETPELFWPQSIRVYDRMRRTDAQVRGTYWAVTLPLRRDIWSLDPAGAREEVVQQIAEDFDLPILGQPRAPRPRRRGRFSWLEHLRLALLELVYGHMPFEQVYYVTGEGAATRVRLRKLAPRFPQTLAAINVATDGGLVSIEQFPAGRGVDQTYRRGAFDRIPIPVSQLVYYCNDREGSSWQGQSIFRPCYKHWLLKDRGMRTQAMSLERTGMGVPIIKAPERATPGQIKELDKMAQNYRAGESAGGALPYGAELELVGIKGNVPDALPAITYHDTQIAKAMLAQFLQLGTNDNTGNRALGEAFVDFFALAVDGIAEGICSTATQHAVEDEVDLNWGPDEPAPAIVARAIDAEKDIPLEALVSLLQVGAITMDDGLESWLREKGGLPARGTTVEQTGPRALPAAARHHQRPRPVGARHAAHRRPPVVATRPRRAVAARMTRRRYLDALADFYAGPIVDALDAAGSPKAIVARFLAGTAARSGRASVAASTSRDRARQAVLDEDLDLTALEDVLLSAYGEGYVVGGHAALDTLPAGANVVETAWERMVDWRTWVPGLAASAVSLALADGSRSLAILQEEVVTVVDGILDTTVDRLTDALVEGYDAGESQARLTARVESALADDARGTTIAMTETNRSMGAAATDTYRDNGVAAREWVALDDPCEDCQAMDGVVALLDEPFPDMGDVPAHPNCRCSTLPVMAEEVGAA